MRIVPLATSLLAAAATCSANVLLQQRAGCNADNCARLVAGTRAGLPSQRRSDCSSFVLATAIPPPAHVTVTITPASVAVATSTITTNPVFEDRTAVSTVYTIIRSYNSSFSPAPYKARDVAFSSPVSISASSTVVSPTAIPAYAAGKCSGASRYSSACSCAGVTPSTTTLSASVTLTVTSYLPSTSLVYVAATTTIERTVFATQTATRTGAYPCASTVQANGTYGYRKFRVDCGKRAVDGTVASTWTRDSESSCLSYCNGIKYCEYVEYQFSTGRCNLYFTQSLPTKFADDPDWDGMDYATN